MTQKMSGWVRLWIVATLAIWGAGAAIGLTHVDQWAARNNVNTGKLPPFAMSRADICRQYGEPYREQCERTDHAPARTFRYFEDGPTNELPTSDELFADAVRHDWVQFQRYWTPYWPWGVAPFALGLLMLGAGWVRSGFRPTEPPSHT